MRIADCGRYKLYRAIRNPNLKSAIRNPNLKSAIRIPNLKSAIRNPQSAIRNPQSATRNPQSAIRNPSVFVQQMHLLNACPAEAIPRKPEKQTLQLKGLRLQPDVSG